MAENLVAWVDDEHLGERLPRTQWQKSGKKHPESHLCIREERRTTRAEALGRPRVDGERLARASPHIAAAVLAKAASAKRAYRWSPATAGPLEKTRLLRSSAVEN
jgi:hypothetical protein